MAAEVEGKVKERDAMEKEVARCKRDVQKAESVIDDLKNQNEELQ